MRDRPFPPAMVQGFLGVRGFLPGQHIKQHLLMPCLWLCLQQQVVALQAQPTGMNWWLLVPTLPGQV